MSDARVVIRLDAPGSPPAFRAGDEVRGRFCVEGLPAGSAITAVERSLLWWTEGKGNQDVRVHDFMKTLGDVAAAGDCFAFRLPPSPWSYEGEIVKIRWAVRLRVFTTGGPSLVADAPIRVGTVTMPVVRQRS